MRTPSEIRNDAIECLRLAGDAEAPEDRDVLLILARAWILLAEQAEHRGTVQNVEPAFERSEYSDETALNETVGDSA